MDAYTNVLLDYENATEIIFSMPPGSEINYPNEVVDYVRSAKNRTESWVSSAGMREIKFQMQTYSSPTLERQLDYFRRTNKYLLLFVPSLDFASEIVINDVQLTEKCETTQTFDVSAYCYGAEGVCMFGSDPRCHWVPDTAYDSLALSGNVTTLTSPVWYREIHEIASGGIWMPPDNYNVVVRTKSSAGSANDMMIGMYDGSMGYVFTGTHTVLSSGYNYYITHGTVASTNMNHVINIFAQKQTSAINTIYVDLIAYVHASGLITV